MNEGFMNEDERASSGAHPTDELSSLKHQWRRRIRSARADSAHHREVSQAHAFARSWERLVNLLALPHPSLPALYVPTIQEPDVSAIIDASARSILPVLVNDIGRYTEPTWGFHTPGSPLETPLTGPAQPKEPHEGPDALAQADIILVPALAVDRSGTRLGQGGGWYDRALQFATPTVPIVAAVFDEEFFDAGTLPRQPHDLPVDGVITPSRALIFNRHDSRHPQAPIPH
ncbi:5-formyltetrahydrofolate cyclo-ligase [Schaalia sp. ZJ405]|uniref:5-formyltetrahydrofolate cyclo-ligase n=1 Tax=Schaalia sp. ZJ405 TaxID=2709403 RepID=UPI0013ECC31E|nr:5-formyltetrahydrofolate cyclo-ligase [Schaalia sp. ZJ405]QPK81013.1 5-formyltetrahydrofolate cyclo-ligase [Schaalia sp. ZJ405]